MLLNLNQPDIMRTFPTVYAEKLALVMISAFAFIATLLLFLKHRKEKK